MLMVMLLNRIAMVLTIGSFTGRSVRVYNSPYSYSQHRYSSSSSSSIISIDINRLSTLIKSNLLLSTVIKLKCSDRELVAVSSNHHHYHQQQKQQQYMTRCVVHNDSHPSMSISDSMGVYHCFSCGASGNLFTLIRTLYKVSSYPDDVFRSVDILAEVDEEVKSCLVRNNLTTLASVVDHHHHPSSSSSSTSSTSSSSLSGLYSKLNTNSNAVASIHAIILLLESRNNSLGNTNIDVRSQVVPSSSSKASVGVSNPTTTTTTTTSSLQSKGSSRITTSTTTTSKENESKGGVVAEDIAMAIHRRKRMVAALNCAAAYYTVRLILDTSDGAATARSFLSSRSISPATASRFQMGYAPGRQFYGAKRDSIHLVNDDGGDSEGDGDSEGGGDSEGDSGGVRQSTATSTTRAVELSSTPRKNHLEYLNTGPPSPLLSSLSSSLSSSSSSSSSPVGHTLDLADSSVKQSILGAGLIDWMLSTTFQLNSTGTPPPPPIIIIDDNPPPPTITSYQFSLTDVISSGLGVVRSKEVPAMNTGKEANTVKECYEKYRNRLMFPIRDVDGSVIGFGGRVLPSTAARRRVQQTGGEAGSTSRTPSFDPPKYINSPTTSVFKKSDTLYGIDLAADGITKSDAAVIVEGYFDVISMHDMGITNVVAALGTSVTINQLVLASSYSKSKRVILLMDGDAAGIQALEQIKNRVEKHRLKDRSTDGILLLTTSIASIRGFIEAEQLIPRISSSSSTSSPSSSVVGQQKTEYYDEVMTHLKDCSDVHTWFNRPDAYRIMQHVLNEATTLL